jgi:hypothetical protein
MSAKARFLVCVLSLASFAAPVFAEAKPAAETGKVAVLDNDRILEGDIERVGDQYRVRRSGGETWLPVAKVLRVCANLEEAFAYLQGQANLDDPAERVRLARWCLLHRLHDQGAAEASAAIALCPKHAEAQRILKALQRSAANETTPTRPATTTAPPAAATPPNLPYNPEALPAFVTRVQPILMNACAGCHRSGQAGSFSLTRGNDDGRRTTQQNLMAALAQLDRERPEDSKLLRYAVTIHGNADRPPLQGRSTPAYRSLEEWARLAVPKAAKVAAEPSRTPRVPIEPVHEAPPRTMPEATGFAAELPPPSTSATPPPVVDAKPPATANEPAVGPNWFNQLQALPQRQHDPASATEERPPLSPGDSPAGKPRPHQAELADPFDPAIFNRETATKQ